MIKSILLISSPFSSKGLLDLALEPFLTSLHFLVAPKDWEDMMRYGLLRMLCGRQSLLTPNIPKAKLLYIRMVHWNSWDDKGHLRSFCDNGSSEAESHNNIELALVVFNAHASCSSWLLHQTDWTNDVNCFFKWLSAIIEFSADGFRHAAIAEGLAQALMFYHDKMCRSLNGSQNVGLQRHCILVAASNPDSRPPDAEKVAKSFPQVFH
ncbi:mediator of RNA polymerase II transcription subunit 25 [Tanacetum coccineum]